MSATCVQGSGRGSCKSRSGLCCTAESRYRDVDLIRSLVGRLYCLVQSTRCHGVSESLPEQKRLEVSALSCETKVLRLMTEMECWQSCVGTCRLSGTPFVTGCKVSLRPMMDDAEGCSWLALSRCAILSLSVDPLQEAISSR